MKSLFETRGVPAASRCFRFWQQSLCAGVALGLTLLSGNVFGQGPYYPVNPPSISLSVQSSPDLLFLQSTLQANHPGETLEVPIPAGESAPSAADYYDTVNRVYTAILTGVGVPANVTQTTMSKEAVAFLPQGTPVATAVGTTSQIAQTIMTYAVNTNTVAAAYNNLRTLTTALAQFQPTQIEHASPCDFDASRSQLDNGHGPWVAYQHCRRPHSNGSHAGVIPG